MEWVLRSPQIHTVFGNLGCVRADGYHVNENCDAALETILCNILSEDKYLRLYRRSVNFGQNIQKDLIPLLIHAKEYKSIELLVKVLVNLTIPIECLLSMDIISKTDFGKHTIFEINNLLASAKAAFTDHRTIKVVIEFLKKNMEADHKAKLSLEQCTNISNSLILLRNILHIPDEKGGLSPTYTAPIHAIQNQILWNIFSQSVDKILIRLMTVPDANNWSVTMVQLIALLYKDQHVVTLHKLLNIWLESSLSDSSEDNESNTSPPESGTDDSSPMLTSDPTSDASDTGGSEKSNKQKDANAENTNPSVPPNQHETSDEKKPVKTENLDCILFATEFGNQELISNSSNEDEFPAKKPAHQKPHNSKQKSNNKGRTVTAAQDRKRKKIVKRGKSHITNVQGLLHKTPTDDDISNVLKEFTVDFLLKGYNSLVRTLHQQILTNCQLEIDTSHFFWLVTYFLKFATQIELDLKHVYSVLSFDIASYLTAEGVNLCEQFELAIKLDGKDLKPCIRRLHLVVTAIREFVQAIEMYKKFPHVGKNDKDILIRLQIQMCDAEELRSLLVLLLRHYNPKYHSKQYLQDLVVTNHILLSFLDNVSKLPEYKGTTKMDDHIKQFATTEVMYQYSLLLEDYKANGVFVNDCIFTLMHHVGGELDSLISLFQPKILKTFTSIWETEFEICDDWSDLIEYVINTFIKKPQSLQTATSFILDTENFDDENMEEKPADAPADVTANTLKKSNSYSNSSEDRWTEDELSSLNWNFMQCNPLPDPVGEIIKMYKEDGIIKTRDSVIRELHKQNLIGIKQFERYIKENERSSKNLLNKDVKDDEIGKICEQLAQDGKSKFLVWVQKVLLETCYARICIEKQLKTDQDSDKVSGKDSKTQKVEKSYNMPVISPVSYHSGLSNQSVPLVPWNCEQALTCKDLKFLQLLHKLGFHMPVDSGKVFIRIPNFWSADILYDVAEKILPIDISTLKFSVNDLTDISLAQTNLHNSFESTNDSIKDVTMSDPPENYYQVHKQNHIATMVNFTPMPGSFLNSEGTEGVKPSWFEIVQKSHEYQITLNINRLTTEDDSGLSAPVATLSSTAPPVGLALLQLPTVITAKEDTTIYSKSECNNSVCETASVASDLTRMYVSDEDEKSEILIRPLMIDTIMDDASSDEESGTRAGKRARVLFSPTIQY